MDHRIRRAVRFIETNYTRRITPEELAQLTDLSRSHFLRLFKKETELSPRQYATRTRIIKASKLLRTGESLTIKEVMTRVGIKDKSNFARSFKKIFGMSPSAYKAKVAGT